MPSGKSKSKENTWTERDLTNAIQGERPRRSKDERKQREDRPEKRHSKDRGEEDREKDRRRKKSERHQEREDGEGSGSRRSKDDRDRKHRDMDKERMKDDDNESGSRSKEKSRKHREDEMESSRDRRDRDERKRNKERSHGEEENGDGQRTHRDKDERSKEKSRRHNEDGMGSSHHRRERDERTRDKERNHGEEENGNDKRRHRQKEERNKEKSRRQREDEMELSRDRRDRDERRRDKERRTDNDEDHETERQRRKDERKHERDEENRDKEKRERRRNKETDERYKDGKRGKDEHHNERRRDKSSDENMRNERKKDRRKHDENDEEERERRRKKQEEAKENNDGDSDGKDRRRKDKKRPEENFEDKQRRREDKEGRKKKGSSQDEDDYDRERSDSVEKKESSRKLESNGRSASISNDAEVVEEMQDGDDYGDYEDDFEDYEDDFEDEDDVAEDENEQDKGKLLEIFEAISAENDDVRSSLFQQNIKEGSRKENEKPAPKSEPHRRINFFAAKQKHVTEVVASKTRRRAQELQNLIELDVASYDIFDLPPLNEYELYIKSYGQSDSKQAYVQCHDDIIEKEMQTEVIDTCTKWTQYPPDDFKGCGEGDESQERNDLQENIFTPHSVDSVRLTNFLQQAGQVCLILLEEKVSARKDLMFKERNDIDISDGFIQLSNKLPFLAGRRVLDMKFNAVQTHLLLTAYDCNNNESNVDKNICLYERGVVCFWNVNEPSQPRKILYCESSPRSCCFSPVKSSLVFAGLEDGSVVVWDIRESSSLHSTIQNKDNQWVVRRPTYSTAGVLFNENHLSPIQSILPIALPLDSAQALSRSTVLQDEPGGVAFQLASLDQSGLVNIWVVIELDKPDEAGSESDLGLSPGGRVKLIRSTSIQIESPQREVFVGSTIQASVIQFSTLDPNHFYVGTDRGWVIHSTRYGEKTSPNVYRPDTESFVTISAIDVSPWNIPVLLVGCKDGALRLHDLRKEYAVRSWPETTNGSAIVQVMWSKSRPSLFFVLDANSNLYIWDLLKKDEHPIRYESFKRGKLLNFSLSNDYESLGIGLPGRKSEMLLNFEGGMIELHRLKDNLLSVQADELDRFASLVDSII